MLFDMPTIRNEVITGIFISGGITKHVFIINIMFGATAKK